MYRSSALLLAVFAAGCAQTPMETTPSATTVRSIAPAAAVTATGTVSAAQAAGGLTRLAPAAAVANIDGWIARLDGVPAAAPVVTDLQTLRLQLQAMPIDGRAVGLTLTRLGAATSAAASADASLRPLGAALSDAGAMLTSGSMSGSAAPMGGDRPMTGATPAVTASGTLEAAQSAGGLTRIAPSAAVANIDGWIARLDGMPAAAPIVGNLRTLKMQLTASPFDGEAVGRTLTELGQQTSRAAGSDAQLSQLGAALTQAGSMLNR